MSDPPLTSVLLAGVTQDSKLQYNMFCIVPTAKGKGSNNGEFTTTDCDSAKARNAVWTVQPNGSLINPITGNPFSSKSNFQTSAGGESYPYMAFCGAYQGPYQTYGMVSDPSKPKDAMCAVMNGSTGELMNAPCFAASQVNPNICSIDPNNM